MIRANRVSRIALRIARATKVCDVCSMKVAKHNGCDKQCVADMSAPSSIMACFFSVILLFRDGPNTTTTIILSKKGFASDATPKLRGRQVGYGMGGGRNSRSWGTPVFGQNPGKDSIFPQKDVKSGRPKNSSSYHQPSRPPLDALLQTAFDGTSDEQFLWFLCVPLCGRGIWCVIRGYPQNAKWGPAR